MVEALRKTNILSYADFLEMSTAEIKYYLAQRGLFQVGNKVSIAARAFVAFEQNIPIRSDIVEVEKKLQSIYYLIIQYLIHLIQDDKWIENVSLWPWLDLGKFFSYIISKKAFDTEYIGQYKAKKAVSYFESRFINKIHCFPVRHDRVILMITKTNSLMCSGANGKFPKVIPLLARLLRDFEIGQLPAVQFGPDREDDARKAFSETVVKIHKNGKLLQSGIRHFLI